MLLFYSILKPKNLTSNVLAKNTLLKWMKKILPGMTLQRN